MILHFHSQCWLLILLCCYPFVQGAGKPGLCEVETSQSSSSIILDIKESRGNETSQLTNPEELPIIGDPNTEIILSLVFPKRNPIFVLDGKRLRLTDPLDRDTENLSHIPFQLTCSIRGRTLKKRSIPVIVRISDINDNAPRFIGTPYETTISELTPIGTTIFRDLKAIDADAGLNGLVEYSIVVGSLGAEKHISDIDRDYENPTASSNSSPSFAAANKTSRRLVTADGFGVFTINLPHQGLVTLNRSLDYEKVQRYLVTVIASDRARNQSERFSTSTTLTVNIRDDDDQNPSFIYQGCTLQDGACINPEYYATVSSGAPAGGLHISPEKIQAIDMDSINAPIVYSFLNGTPSSYRNYFEINQHTALVRQLRPVDFNQVKVFHILVKAEEVSPSKRWTTAKLTITVKPVDSNRPEIHATALEGFVDENSPVGTKVVDSAGKPVRLTVTDADIGPDDPKPNYIFELTTTLFTINDEGVLVVNEDNLDRDPPSPGKFRFQIIAREKMATAASNAISMTVTLNDVNDNAPRLPMIPPITIQAGDTRRRIVKVEANDIDSGPNAEITYSIYHISNSGLSKFTINPKTGLIESIGKLSAGEQYSITVQATDKGGKYSQTIVEVMVVPGPNTKSPVFQQAVYETTVSEGVPLNTTVLVVRAVDPEGGPVMYSIVSGNDLREFGIDEKSGVISVVRKLDREQLTHYQLIIKAEDEDGLSSTATVNIKVSDINDKNPEFVNLPYEFSVKEGIDGAPVGQVKAIDADEGQNAIVYYSLQEDVPFIIDVNSGHIRTSKALDYEKQQSYKFIVTARDGASEPRLATATVTVDVLDVEDEVPIFHLTSYEARVPENAVDTFVTQVKADDPDTVKKITYIIKQGPTDLFKIDPNTGVIKTKQGLDYEKDTQHILIIGTLENNSTQPGATTKVMVRVEDRNDNPPEFLTVPRPITLNDDVPIGTKVTTVNTADADGTSPSNKVRYEIVGRGKAPKYFQIDADLGEVQVKNDLRREPDSEYQVDIKAYDLGEPSLSSTISVPIFISHTKTPLSDVKVGFTDDSYTAEVLENSPTNTLVKTLSIINSKTLNNDVPLRCTIVSGNSEKIFYANITSERNCEIRIKEAKLDFEHEDKFELSIRLDTVDNIIDESRRLATVTVHVIDVNDNKPTFQYPESSKRFAKNAYYGAVARDREVGSSVIQVRAIDRDSGKYGQIEFKFVEDNVEATSYFSIDPMSGLIKTLRTFDNVDDSELPFRLKVQAMDDPSSTKNSSHVEVAHVVINLIEDQHRMILVINDARPEIVKKDEEKIISILEEHSRLIVGIEKIVARQYRKEDNLTTDNDQSSTDLWFYTLDPLSETILERNNSRVARSILEHDAISNITLDVSANLHATASSIHAPLMTVTPKAAIITIQWELLPYALVLVAIIIFVLGVGGIIYMCISWKRYKAYKENMARMYVTPRYDPVFVEPNLKEYETQVLQMSVPVDDTDSYNDLQLDFSKKNHTFNLDNVSYITKETGEISPVSSEAATTTRASSFAEHNGINRNGFYGHMNRAYMRSSEEDILQLNASPTNENVTFKEKKDYSQMGFNYLSSDRPAHHHPVETTTEL